MKRRKSKAVKVGNIVIGGASDIIVQSMTNTDTRDVSSTVEQIYRLQDAGCQLVRVAVPDMKAAKILGRIKERISIPLAADIHFAHTLALEALEQGVDKLRLNPGNIRDKRHIKEVAKTALKNGVPIRIGVNSGSLSPELLMKYGFPSAEAMVESALWEVELLENVDFDKIIISIKSFDVPETLKAYRLLAKKTKYPFHVGITEAGPAFSGSIRSAVGIGALLAEGLGDTVRVSLTADPVEEVKVAYEILKSLKLKDSGAVLVSCPTCGRTEIDLLPIVEKVEENIAGIKAPIKVAVMGCVVNGPGEARCADVGIAGGKGQAILFRKGKLIRKIKESEIITELLKEIDIILKEK